MTDQKIKESEGQSPLWVNIFKRKTEKHQEIMDILAKIPVFCTLNKGELRKVSHIVYERNYKIGEFLFKEGNPGSGMFIIKDGSMSIERSSDENDIMKLAVLEEGDFVGELALLDDSPRSASARCLQKTTVIAFFRQDLFHLIDRNPVLGSKILIELSKMIGMRLRETNKMSHKYKQVAIKYKKMLEKKSDK